MDEEGTRRNSQNLDAEASAGGGWTNTTTAGKALGVSPRTVQTYIRKGLLQGKVEGEGVRRTWYVGIDSLNTLRAQRIAEGDVEVFREGSAEQVAEGIAEAMQNLSERLADEAARAAEYRTRLELTEQAQSTMQEEARGLREENERLREEQAAERHRREAAEREREELRLRLEAAIEAREAPETASEEPYSTHAPPGGYGTSSREAEESLHPRSWWRRFFGFD
jgi:hypothetical protein